MSRLQLFQVFPAVPEPLSFLEVLSRNIWWSWHYDGIELFRRIDPKLWDKAERNPILFLTYISQDRLKELAEDNSFLAHLNRVREHYESQIVNQSGGEDYDHRGLIAYFSMEFGIHESIPLFAGGLGVLAGDHLKAASDIGLPMVGVGLLYRHGYFRQYLDPDGWQQEEYPETNIHYLPIQRVRDELGNKINIAIEGPDSDIHAAVWRLMVGRIPLYLLDSNRPRNAPHIREITSRLYAGEEKIRLAQEFLLGIGGMRALEAMGIYPTVCHMNEGHSAFLSLERLKQVKKRYNIDLKTAMEIVPRTTVFTTHTPVPAGHEEFPAEMVKPYLETLAKDLEINIDHMLSWGQRIGSKPQDPISMFTLGLRMAQYRNGVSELHGRVARQMSLYAWPEIPEEEIPISHITNGIHIPTWISHENALLFDRYIGPDWTLHPSDPDNIDHIDDIYDEELWRAHGMSRSRLIRTCRRHLMQQYKRRHAPRAILEDMERALDQDILTIAFARRFATYKRAHLLLQDPDRLESILTSKIHPVQIIFAGKAHPKDNEGKGLIKKLIDFVRYSEARHRIVFLEDYDIHMARHLVHGADVWLNTPRRPYEACGTSGMKAAINGVLNVSILDGWWCEGYAENRGWKIGNGEEYTEWDYQDSIESQALYNVLENDVIPCFYERRNGDVPTRWLQMMKESMKMAMRVFCSHRMVVEYENRFYLPGEMRLTSLTAEDAKEAKQLAKQRERYQTLWKNVRIEEVNRDYEGPYRVGENFRVTAVIHLGELSPDEVDVEVYYGFLKTVDTLTASENERMNIKEDRQNGFYLYEKEVACRHSGRYGFTVRIMPRGDKWTRFLPGIVTWA